MLAALICGGSSNTRIDDRPGPYDRHGSYERPGPGYDRDYNRYDHRDREPDRYGYGGGRGGYQNGPPPYGYRGGPPPPSHGAPTRLYTREDEFASRKATEERKTERTPRFDSAKSSGSFDWSEEVEQMDYSQPLVFADTVEKEEEKARIEREKEKERALERERLQKQKEEEEERRKQELEKRRKEAEAERHRREVDDKERREKEAQLKREQELQKKEEDEKKKAEEMEAIKGK